VQRTLLERLTAQVAESPRNPPAAAAAATSQIHSSPLVARTAAAITTVSLGTIGSTASSAHAPSTAR
jgi:hypothetical protein